MTHDVKRPLRSVNVTFLELKTLTSTEFVPIAQDFYDDMKFELTSIKTFKPFIHLK